MCCFTTQTEVHDTKIFARYTAPDTQITVYQMRYTSAEPTAMILPLPVALPAREEQITWKNLREYGTFFSDLDAGFPAKPEVGVPLLRRQGMASAAAVPLEVHDVGDFVASFVPTIDDFSRLDPRFVIKKDVWAKIPGYQDHGFAVFQLKSLAGSPHPIAFEWKTRLRDTLFFPTVHIHDGTVHAQDDFDHALYLQDASFDRRVGSYDGPTAADRSTGFVRSQERAALFASSARSLGVIQDDLLVHKRGVWGRRPNVDTLVSLLPPQPAGCGRCDLAAPSQSTTGLGATALAALTWVIRRRDELRARR